MKQTKINNMMIWACKYDHVEIVKLLLETGANISNNDIMILSRIICTANGEVLKVLEEWIKNGYKYA